MWKTNQRNNTNNYHYGYKIVLVLMFIVYMIRAVNLDADIPNWGIGEYTPRDEGYYAMQAYQNVNHNNMQKTNGVVTENYKMWNSSLSLLNTIFCTTTLWLFGNNYYGLRMSSVIAGAIVLIMLMLLMNLDNRKECKTVSILLGFFIIFNFPFEMASRIVEPGVYRMLILCLSILFFYMTHKKEALCYSGMGVLAIWALIFGYITNVFVFVPIGIILLYDLFWNHSLPLRKIVLLLSGLIVGYGSGELLYFLCQKRWFVQDMLRVVMGREIRRATLSFENLYWNLKAVLQSNMFGYNATFLILSILAVLYCVYLGHRKRDVYLIYISWMAVGFGLQGVFTSDFLIRKSIAIFPVLILNIFYLMLDVKDIYKFMIVNKKMKYKAAICISLIAMLCLLLAVKRIQDVDETDMSNIVKYIMIALNGISVLILIIFIFICKKKKVLIIYCGIIISLILPNLYMNYKYIYTAEKTEKEAMEDMLNLGNSYVLGGSAYSCCLYNDIIPISSCYDNYFPEDYNARATELLKRNDVNYYIGYNDIEMIDDWLKGTEYKWKLVRKYKTNYSVAGQSEDTNDIFVFRKVGR